LKLKGAANCILGPEGRSQKLERIVNTIDLASEFWLLSRYDDRQNARAGSASIALASRQLREVLMIRKLASGEYRLYSRKRDPKTGRRRNLGTFRSRAAAEKHERAVQFFKARG
jgi:hypothetical protein